MNAAITNPVVLVILIIGTFLGLSLSFFLLLNKSAKNSANIYLGTLVFVIQLYFLTGFLFRFDLLEQFPHIIGLQNLVGFLFGPLSYLYVRASTQFGFQLKPILLLHFLPFLVNLLFSLPIFMQTGQEKIDMYNNFVQNGILVEPNWVLITKTIHGLVYFLLASSVIFTYRKHLTNTVSSIDRDFHRWLLVFIMVLILPLFGFVGFVFIDIQGSFIFFTLLGLFSFILVVYIATIVKPELFYIFPHQMLLPESTEVKKQKYESSKLQATQKDNYLAKITAYVEREKPYQSSELTLAELAENVKIPAHYVSQVINEKLGVNFLDFINGHRIIAAKKMLVDSEWSHYTIISIAYEAGFNSKSTFYSVFKKHTGMTPSAYRKQSFDVLEV